jgi:hypothetical protein
MTQWKNPQSSLPSSAPVADEELSCRRWGNVGFVTISIIIHGAGSAASAIMYWREIVDAAVLVVLPNG